VSPDAFRATEVEKRWAGWSWGVVVAGVGDDGRSDWSACDWASCGCAAQVGEYANLGLPRRRRVVAADEQTTGFGEAAKVAKGAMWAKIIFLANLGAPVVANSAGLPSLPCLPTLPCPPMRVANLENVGLFDSCMERRRGDSVACRLVSPGAFLATRVESS
jgi:hypothetical protein